VKFIQKKLTIQYKKSQCNRIINTYLILGL